MPNRNRIFQLRSECSGAPDVGVQFQVWRVVNAILEFVFSGLSPLVHCGELGRDLLKFWEVFGSLSRGVPAPGGPPARPMMRIHEDRWETIWPFET